ncbi:MAG TPA: hypothetical protein VK699_05170 [Terriglobales bacterium]|jgi:hypothetical protein|nr:hypothetical protein [Terriglobales bacterium]
MKMQLGSRLFLVEDERSPKEETIMRNRLRLRMFGVAALLTLFVAGEAGYGQAKKGTQTDTCSTANLPEQIQNKLATSYTGWKVVTPAMFNASDLHIWNSDHSKECPGMITGKFSDSQVGYVLNLIKRENNRTRQQVLYFHPSADGYGVEIVVPPAIVKEELQVIVKTPPEKLADAAETQPHPKIKTDSVSVSEVGSWPTIYYWEQGRIHKIETGD